MKIAIIGDGVFGNFMKIELHDLNDILLIDNPSLADFILMCVPFESIESVAIRFKDKHLINVCSVQEETNIFCTKHTKNVTGIHPMFGPRSPKEGRTSLLTMSSENSSKVIDVFSKMSDVIDNIDGVQITGEMHDKMMAKTHKKVVEISDHILKLVDEAKDIPDNCLPTSFKRLKQMAEQFLDMPSGTRSSILANKFD